MIKEISYEVALCASRHKIKNSRGQVVTDSIFPEKCKLNVRELDTIARHHLKKYSDLNTSTDEIYTLNVYVTGFTPALVSLINMIRKVKPSLAVVLWHWDYNTKAFTPQVLLCD